MPHAAASLPFPSAPVARLFDLSALFGFKRPWALERSPAHEDRMTGLYHRVFFEQRLATEFAVAQRLGMRLAVLMIDLDHFQHMNDAYGHATCDVLLRAVAERIHHEGARDGIAARYCDDEFVVVARGLTEGAALARADRIRESLVDLRVKASVGVAVHSREVAYSSPLDLVEAAKEALSTSKREGRDRSMLNLLPSVPTRRVDGTYRLRFGTLRALTKKRAAVQSKPRLGSFAL